MSESPKQEIVIEAVPASPGLGRGPLFLYFQGELEIPRFQVPPERVEEEISRFEIGLMETRKQISSIRGEVEERVGEEEASIFDAQQLVLEDRALIEDTIGEVVQTGLNIEYCLQRVANRYLDAFAQIDDDYIKERAADIRDVTKRLIRNLLGHSHDARDLGPDNAYVLVAHELSPSDTAVLNAGEVKAIVTEIGSFTSHSVIMARSLNIAAVVGAHDIMQVADSGDEILVDGYQGIVYLNPSKETLERYGRVETEHRYLTDCYESERRLPAVTADGVPFGIALNVEGIETPKQLQNSGADGVGLFRTENLFMAPTGFPSEEEQFQIYRDLVQKMHPYPVTIRTLDLGGDKNPHRSLLGYTEANPFMGFRGIRFCLENPQIFKEQLRAALRASQYGKVKILYPMVCNVDELMDANTHLESCKDELRSDGIAFDEKVQQGTMIEVPSAVAILDLLAKHSDFFSIGTNDLIQYLLAVDRINDRISYLYDASQPPVVRTLATIFRQSEELGIPVSVCGELAGDPLYAPLLLGMGTTELSVSLGQLATIKFLLRRVTSKEVRKLAKKAVESESAAEIKALLVNFREEKLKELSDQARTV